MKWSVPLLGLLLVPLLFNSVPLEILRLKTFDTFVETPEPSGYFSIINITEEDVDKYGGYPLPRENLAEIHLDILKKGALGVGWVMLFPHPDRLGGDDKFADTLAFSPSVIGMPEVNNNLYPATHGTVIKGPDINLPKAQGFLENIPKLKESANQGAISAPVDVDNLVRRLPLLQQTPEGWVASFGTEVLKILGGGKTYQIVTNPNGIEMIRVRGLNPIPTDSLGRKWVSWVDTPQMSLHEMRTICNGVCQQNNIEGKFVFVGFTAKGISPQLATPNGLLEPHKIQAALAESILIDSPTIPDYRLFIELLLLCISGLLIAFIISYFGITWGLLLATTLISSVAGLGYYFISLGYLVDVTWSLISMTLIATQQFYLNFRTQFKLRQQIKKQFETYLDPRQVALLQKNPELLKLGGERREMTFLFMDICGFTPISEHYKNNDDPEGLVLLVNEFLNKMTNIILANGGTIDKYMGDCIMAFWNAPLECKNHAEMAVKSGIEIEEEINELKKEYDSRGLPPINVGTGINTGTCIVGNMGSESRFDYSVIGDAVNLAARLEATAGRGEYIDNKTIMSRATALQLPSGWVFTEIGNIKVKGKEEEIRIYSPDLTNQI